ncbi:MAG: CspA family cold shock protein [Oleiphilaceae bacterium]|jgi:CspA family cold shock protein
MSTQSLSKKLLISAIVALPFPYILLIATQLAGSLPNGLSASAFLSSDQGASFYIVAWLIFLAASLVSTVAAAGNKAGSTYSNNSDGSDGLDSSDGPEGSESGSVKWFNVNKGFGFITTDAGEDVFVHFRSIRGHGRRSLRQGQLVRFDLSDGEKGKQADNVSVVK